MPFFSEQLVDLIVEIANLELTEAGILNLRHLFRDLTNNLENKEVYFDEVKIKKLIHNVRNQGLKSMLKIIFLNLNSPFLGLFDIIAFRGKVWPSFHLLVQSVLD
jgi:hypothetical protein